MPGASSPHGGRHQPAHRPAHAAAPGESVDFDIDFAFNIVDEDAVSARGGYEHFPDDERPGGNDIFLLAQWFPRLHAYTDYEGWTNKEFLGRGEFTLEFGDYTSTSPCRTITSCPPPACCRTPARC
jgi:hypothetical protein